MDESQIFISYSHKNKRELEMLRSHLTYLEHTHNLQVWDDQSILPGMRWRDALDTALQTAKVAVLLVSADFLASDFIAKEELPVILKAAQEGKLVIISIVLSSCSFAATPLAAYQAFDRPLSLMSKAKRDEVLSQIVQEITNALLRTQEDEEEKEV